MKRILIVDDDPLMREALHQVLHARGYSVLFAGDGQEGIVQLSRRRCDLVLLELNLPKVTGFDFLDVALVSYPAVPVIVLTGFIDQCEPEALLGADAVVEKPPDLEALQRLIERALSESAQERLRRLGAVPNRFKLEAGLSEKPASVWHGTEARAQGRHQRR